MGFNSAFKGLNKGY